ncbi:MAG TPA: electron transport complex subunit RsxA [Clostridiales bacterium]|nr:electron transport complex subunit RsxA [Clostridiales bacterium]
MKEMLIILFSAILVDNFVLSKFIGICPFLGVSKNLKTAMGMSMAVIFVLVLATAITWPIYQFFLFPLNLDYLQIIIFILVIAALVQIIETFLKKSIPVLYRALGIYLPLITTNCAVLAVTLLNIEYDYTFLQSIIYALGVGCGFMLALFLFAGVRSKVDHADVPEFFKGLPITLVSASLVSLSFFGFKGLIERLFS